MSKRTDFDYSEFLKYAKQMGRAEEEFKTWLKYFLLEQAQRVVRDAKDRTPIDTGALINSYQIGTQKITLMDDPTGRMAIKSKDKPARVIDTDNSTIDDIKVINDYLEVTISNPMEYASYVEYGHHLSGKKPYQGQYMLTIAVQDVIDALPFRFTKQFYNFINGGL